MAGKSCAIPNADDGEAYLSLRLQRGCDWDGETKLKTKEAHEPVRLARKQR
jgi:hypothetical protein